ncbi:unnamed protein product [Orchesella dallaii]|uniref:Fructose-2,6-bisphosphatase TIGAR n=1 Tax=Orchesella dallaii TaxID=48710 RepID=A0ABP1QF76_9HEXA
MNGVSQVQVHKSTIYLVRHGESAANVAQINLKPEDDVLTEKGRTQADLLGKHLKDVVFTKAFASTYSRSQDTANFILTNSNMTVKPELKIDARIRERELGDFVGKPASDAFMALFAAVKQGTPLLKFEIPGAETTQEFDGRIETFVDDLFDELRQSTQPETVLIVSHGLTILRLLARLREPSKGLELQSWCFNSASTPMKNTSYHLFTVQVPSRECENEKICLDFLKYNQRSHLEPLGESNVDHGESLASAFTKLKQVDASSNCAMQ